MESSTQLDSVLRFPCEGRASEKNFRASWGAAVKPQTGLTPQRTEPHDAGRASEAGHWHRPWAWLCKGNRDSAWGAAGEDP